MKSRYSLIIFFLAAFSVSAHCETCLTEKDSVARIVSGMTLKEKVCQLFVIRPEALNFKTEALEIEYTRLTDDMREFFREYPVGGFSIYARNIVCPEQLSEFTSELQSLSPRPLLYIDEEGGRVARIANNDNFGLDRFASMTALANGNDENTVYDAALYIGSYLHLYGFDIDFAPVADVNTNPENIVIGPRAFSENPQTAATMVTAYLRGLRDAGITGCLKHFPGHGDTKNDTHYQYAESGKTWDELTECEMIPFKAGIDAGAEMIMTAHISVPKVTGTGIPSTMSAPIIKEKLRGELGFDGLIITDALEMAAVSSQFSTEEAAVETIKAGADILLIPSDLVRSVRGVMEAVENGDIDESVIDERVSRIISLKLKRWKIKSGKI